MSDIFISYASQDRSRVRPLADALSRHGWSVWWDRQIQAGKTFDQVIADALASARCVVVVWSRDSVASSWVREEADEGRKRGVLIPVLIDEVGPPLGFGRIQAARMIEWDSAPESEAFQKLAADVTAVIGAPSGQDATPETSAPMASDRVAVAAQMATTRSEFGATPRIAVHGRTVRVSLAGALVVALFAMAAYLAIGVYRTGSTVGDFSQPRPTHTPGEVTALRLTAVLADGGEPLPQGVTYEVYTAAQDAEGNRKRVARSEFTVGPPRFPLPAGRYFVTAAYDSASANAEVEVTPAVVTHQILNLRAGILRLTAILADGGEPLPQGVTYEVYTAAQDAEGNRKRIARSEFTVGPPRFPLPAGRYFVTAAYDSASANAEVEVTPAVVTHQILNLRAGILRLTAILADGGEPLPQGVTYEVYTAAQDAEGNRKRVARSEFTVGPPRFPLPAGRYFVTAAYDSASANAEVEVTPAVVTHQILNLRAGILRLTAILADGGEPLPQGVTYEVYTAAQDAEGNRKRVARSEFTVGPPRFPLPAGRYFVTAAYSGGNASAETMITAGGTQDVQVRIVPVTKR